MLGVTMGPTMETGLDAIDRGSPIVCAARYGRNSTGDQKNSVAIQFEAIDAYAAIRGIRIVRTYVDDGISGLSIERREALQDLIEDVQSGRADFTAILVYDVSRWGRFQDVDESAYYEFICRKCGVVVHYCAELFQNDGSFFAAIGKGLKRAMAADYSRDLSVKVFAGHARLVKHGYSQGGSPGYGLRRMLVDQTGAAKFQLAPGQHKAIATDRIVLVPGPKLEVRTIRWIFRTFVQKRKSEREIAKILNRRELPAVNDRSWTRESVCRVLLSERYIGNYVWNQESVKLKTKLVSNPPEKWIRAEGAIAPIVPRSLFEAAQDIVRERLRKLTDDEKLEPLRRLLRKHGFLCRRIIDNAPGVPSSASYFHWFGGLIPTYKLVGFAGYREVRRRRRPFRSRHATTLHLSDDDLIALLRESLQKHGYLNRKIIDETEGIPAAGTYYLRFGGMKRVYQLAGFPKAFERPGESRTRSARHCITLGLSNAQLLELLRQLLQTHGYLSEALINKSAHLPSPTTYARRFGGLKAAYKLIGFRAGKHTSSGVWKTTERMSKRALLAALKNLLDKNGRLTRHIINRAPGIPSHATFQRRFGSLTEAYRLIGLPVGRNPPSEKCRATLRLSNEQLLERLRRLRRSRGRVSCKIIDASSSMPSTPTYRRRFGSMKQVYRLIGGRTEVKGNRR